MRHLLRNIVVALLLCLSLPLWSQLRIGEWRTHFSFSQCDKVLHTPNKVYALSGGHLFSYDPEDQSIEAYSSMDGLHGNFIEHLAYNEATRTTMLVYKDGNIDLLTPEGNVVNLSDYRDKSLAADKKVNRVRMFDEYAFLATNVGAILLNLQRQEISESYLFRQEDGSYLQVSDVLMTDTCYYLATNLGLYQGFVKDNLLDFSYWKKLKMYVSPQPSLLADWRGQLLVATGMRVYDYSPHEQKWSLRLQYYSDITDMHVDNDFLVLERPGFVTGVHRWDGSQLRFKVGNDLLTRCYDNVSIDFAAGAERFYAASGSQGISIWNYDAQGDYYHCVESGLLPNGPYCATAWKLYVLDNEIYATGGGRWGDRYHWPGAIVKYQDGEWISLLEDPKNIEQHLGFSLRDVLSFAIDPSDETHLFACTWGDGLMEFRDGALQTCHTYHNSPLVTMFPESDPHRYVRVDGATYDAQGNLWLLNSDLQQGKGGVHILQPDGSWLSPNYRNFYASAPSWDDILFSNNGLIWMNSERINPGLFVIDPQTTLSDFSDDNTRWISHFVDQDGRTLEVFTLHCMAEDLDGTMWLGTNIGPLLIANNRQILEQSTPVFTRVKVPRNDGTMEADYLLGNSRVNAIAVDAANRKWIATESDGLYLLSPDGYQTIHHFTADNSPLPSNTVYSVVVHPLTGEVFVGTEAGIVSYRSDAVQASSSFSSVSVYPNPVRPEFVGDVVVRGLMESSQVKITDLHGRLLATGESLGGQFLWDLSHPDGHRVSSGVYLVYAADENGESGVVAKIVVVN